jgi:hypothetical protein
MSKKLIAVASAAALALSALVGVAPVNAVVGPFGVTVSGTTSTATAARDGSTSAKALQINVPSADVIRFIPTNQLLAQGDSTAIKFDVVTPGTTDAVTVTSTGGVKVITTTVFTTPAVTANGVQSLALTAADGLAAFYAFTTSTTAGTVVVSSGGSSKTYYVTGLSDSGYKLALTAASSAALGGKIEVTGTVKDAFGNDLTTPIVVLAGADFGFTPSAVGATLPTFATYTAATKSYKFVFVAPAVAQAVAVQVALKITPTTVTAFGSPVLTQFFSVGVQDLEVQVTALTAQVATLTAQLAVSRLIENSVTQKKYNTLARKWNKANPGAKVALKE